MTQTLMIHGDIEPEVTYARGSAVFTVRARVSVDNAPFETRCLFRMVSSPSGAHAFEDRSSMRRRLEPIAAYRHYLSEQLSIFTDPAILAHRALRASLVWYKSRLDAYNELDEFEALVAQAENALLTFSSRTPGAIDRAKKIIMIASLFVPSRQRDMVHQAKLAVRALPYSEKSTKAMIVEILRVLGETPLSEIHFSVLQKGHPSTRA